MEDLGGAMSHASKSGVCHMVRPNEAEVLKTVRQLYSYMPASNKHKPPFKATDDPVERRDGTLDELIPNDSKAPYDMKAVVSRVVDDGDFLEVMPHWGMNLIIGFARLGGHAVGIVGNQPAYLAGCLDIDASIKGGRFVRFCDAFNIPLVTFVDVPGFLPGVNQEHGGIIRNGAKLLYAFCEASVPKITCITRKAYGGAYDVMASKHIRADYNFAWPSSEIAVMGPDGAVNIVFRKEMRSAEDKKAKHAELVADYRERFATPYYAAERGYVDDVIKPSDTRPTLIRALEAILEKDEPRPKKKHGNVPL